MADGTITAVVDLDNRKAKAQLKETEKYIAQLDKAEASAQRDIEKATVAREKAEAKLAEQKERELQAQERLNDLNQRQSELVKRRDTYSDNAISISKKLEETQAKLAELKSAPKKSQDADVINQYADAVRQPD